jgi:hypothetical protein
MGRRATSLFQGCHDHLQNSYCAIVYVDAALHILQCIKEKVPEQFRSRDGDGSSPLHLVARNNHCFNDRTTTECRDESDYASDLIRFLLKEYPESAGLPDAEGRLPLHVAMEHNLPLPCFEIIANAEPRALPTRCMMTHMYPFQQSAVLLGKQMDPLIQFLRKEYPESAALPDDAEGRLPLHFAMKYDLALPCFEIIANAAEPPRALHTRCMMTNTYSFHLSAVLFGKQQDPQGYQQWRLLQFLWKEYPGLPLAFALKWFGQQDKVAPVDIVEERAKLLLNRTYTLLRKAPLMARGMAKDGWQRGDTLEYRDISRNKMKMAQHQRIRAQHQREIDHLQLKNDNLEHELVLLPNSKKREHD